MKASDIPDCVREALCAQEAFRRVGFTPDEIYCRPQPDRLFVTLKRSGIEFNADVGRNTVPMADFARVWRASTKWWNEHGKEALVLYEKSELRKNVVSLTVALVARGFNLRTVEDA